jgi:hypothetical protein
MISQPRDYGNSTLDLPSGLETSLTNRVFHSQGPEAAAASASDRSMLRAPSCCELEASATAGSFRVPYSGLVDQRYAF